MFLVSKLHNRSYEEEQFDRLLLLHLIKKTSEKGYIGKTKTQKLAFLTERSLKENKSRGFNQEFYKSHFGPTSNDVFTDIKFLLDNKIMTKNESGDYEVTEYGSGLVKQNKKLIKRNQKIFDKAYEIAQKYRDMNTHEIKKIVYDLAITLPDGNIKTIEKMNHATTIYEKPETTCNIDSGQAETLAILFNKKLTEDLRKARREGTTSSPYMPLPSS